MHNTCPCKQTSLRYACLWAIYWCTSYGWWFVVWLLDLSYFLSHFIQHWSIVHRVCGVILRGVMVVFLRSLLSGNSCLLLKSLKHYAHSKSLLKTYWNIVQQNMLPYLFMLFLFLLFLSWHSNICSSRCVITIRYMTAIAMMVWRV